MNFLPPDINWWSLAIGLVSLVLASSTLLFLALYYDTDEPLPKPRPDCIDEGPLEAWEVGQGRVRMP